MNLLKKLFRYLFVSDRTEKRCALFIPHEYIVEEHLVEEATGEYIDDKPIMRKRTLHTEICSICEDVLVEVNDTHIW